MFWIVSGSNSSIGKASMDGMNEQTFPVTGAPTSLSIESDGILWTDTWGDIIFLTSFDGNSSIEYLAGFPFRQYAFSKLNDTIYFVGPFAGIQSFHVNSTGADSDRRFLGDYACRVGQDIEIITSDKQEQGNKPVYYIVATLKPSHEWCA